MRTGNFRFGTTYAQRRWFVPPRPVQVLMVEVDEPVDAQGTRAVTWRAASAADLEAYQKQQRQREIDLALAKDRIERLERRMESIEALAGMP